MNKASMILASLALGMCFAKSPSKPSAVPSSEQKLCKTGLFLTKASGQSVEDWGDLGCQITIPNVVIFLSKTSSFDAKTLDEARQRVKEDYSADQLLDEPLDGGFILHYHNVNDFKDQLYSVTARLSLRGKIYQITGSLQDPQAREAAFQLIKSIH